MRLDVYGVPVGWFHSVLTLQGDNLIVYQNKIAYDGPIQTGSAYAPYGSGTVVIGKGFLDRDNYRGTVEVDELAMWNRALCEDEVAQIYDMFSE